MQVLTEQAARALPKVLVGSKHSRRDFITKMILPSFLDNKTYCRSTVAVAL